jgi:protein-disulfide isomerase
MYKNKATLFLKPAILLTALLCCTTSTINAAETKGDSSAPISQNTADAILKELKGIRAVLEKIEKQGDRGQPSRPTTAQVSTKGKHEMGSKDAPITIAEFTDYQCPYCLRFTKTTFPLLKSKYIDTGKVRWVALNLPLAFHKDAIKAAQAAHCAGEQGKFWEMREELFKNPKRLNLSYLPAHAATISLDIPAFNACLQSNRHLDDIDKDAKDAKAVRLTGTPSFIIGKTTSDVISGPVIIGAQPINKFDAEIDKLLAAQAKKK